VIATTAFDLDQKVPLLRTGCPVMLEKLVSLDLENGVYGRVIAATVARRTVRPEPGLSRRCVSAYGGGGGYYGGYRRYYRVGPDCPLGTRGYQGWCVPTSREAFDHNSVLEAGRVPP
jgi:hypothetical protein